MKERTCARCGKTETTDRIRGFFNCDDCRAGRADRYKHPCADCGTPVKKSSTRCHACRGKSWVGESHPGWKGGVSKPEHWSCADCGCPISYGSARCVQCTGKASRSEASQHWKGGRTVHDAGYVQIHRPDHHRAKAGSGYVFEHILVAEEKIGRLLTPTEVVHHINEVKDDNRPENLMVFPDNSAHMRHHAALRETARTHCKSGLHEWTPENIEVRANGLRQCIPCRQAAQRRRYQAKKARGD